MDRNPQIELAERYVMETSVSIFLTGKAGTGKTTFLHHIAECCPKRSVVLAPTGVAAVNAGGVTIHSFFQLPFCPYLPEVKELVTEYQMPDHKTQLRKSKIDIIRTLELLIIDEISMVRADLLDAVDATLRRYRHSSKPFGGVQLLMIGDVQQLAPVVTDDEKPYMDRVYPSPFFFHSKALQRTPYTTIQLTTIYRQQDPVFVNILNNIRDNHFDRDTLDTLNTRVVGQRPANEPKQQEPILLTTHNYQADRVNQHRLEALDTAPFTLEAEVQGNFPESSFPTAGTLTLKPGAQVMFVKNDSSGAHRYFNGKIGTIKELLEVADGEGRKQRVVAVIDDDGDTINVTPETWENLKYEIDPKDNQIKQIVDGTFTQYPLKTAWAVTIHKAQGLTFDRVQVDASAAFTYGQVYVALSRCRSLEGLTLLAPISANHIFDSTDIAHFNTTLTPPETAAQQLDACRTQYYYDMLFELFDFSALQHEAERIERIFQDNLRNIYPGQCATLSSLVGQEMASLMTVADRFRRQLAGIGQQADAESLLAERINKATAYFLEQLELIDGKVTPTLGVDIDNKEVAKRLKDLAGDFAASMGLKKAVLERVREKGFDIATYQKAKVDFTLQKPKKEKPVKDEAAYADNKNPKLVKILTKWRREKAKELELPAYTILQQKAVLAIADGLPQDGKALLKTPGMGPASVARYGLEILQMVRDYCDELANPKEPPYVVAARLLAEGKSVEDVAGAMLRAVSTVESYLATAVEKGILDADLVVPAEAQDEILSYMVEHPETTALKPIYEHFEGRYSYCQLRIARFLSQDLS